MTDDTGTDLTLSAPSSTRSHSSLLKKDSTNGSMNEGESKQNGDSPVEGGMAVSEARDANSDDPFEIVDLNNPEWRQDLYAHRDNDKSLRHLR